ncbi:TPA: glycosyltransferase family 2 protein, partial [Vibrio cholerae]
TSLKSFDEKNDAMMISPLVIDRGVNINPYLIVRKNKRYMMFWNIILSSFFTFKMFHKVNKYRTLLSSKKSHSSTVKPFQKIYGSHGSVFILKNEYFLRGGSLRRLPFLYGEEIYIAEQVRNLGGDCVYYPLIKFEHKGSATLGNDASRFKYSCIKQGHSFLYKEFYR